jgi:hypothetical protein
VRTIVAVPKWRGLVNLAFLISGFVCTVHGDALLQQVLQHQARQRHRQAGIQRRFLGPML